MDTASTPTTRLRVSVATSIRPKRSEMQKANASSMAGVDFGVASDILRNSAYPCMDKIESRVMLACNRSGTIPSIFMSRAHDFFGRARDHFNRLQVASPLGQPGRPPQQFWSSPSSRPPPLPRAHLEPSLAVYGGRPPMTGLTFFQVNVDRGLLIKSSVE